MLELWNKYCSVTTYYGKNRGRGLSVRCRNCGAEFDPLEQDHDTSLCPSCNERRTE